MSDTPDTPQASIPIPDGWADMSDDEKSEYVAAALTRAAQETGVLDPADAEPIPDGESNIADDETAEPDEAPASDEPAEAASEAEPPVRVFKAPGQE